MFETGLHPPVSQMRQPGIVAPVSNILSIPISQPIDMTFAEAEDDNLYYMYRIVGLVLA